MQLYGIYKTPSFSNNIFIMRNILVKLLAITVTVAFLVLTAADMYIKTYGDISEYPADENLILKTDALTLSTARDKNIIRIMSYNILSDSAGFEGAPAAQRADGVCRIIEGISPDVAGLQEMSRKWFACIYNNTGYKFTNPVRTGFLGTMTAIIYNPETLFLIISGEEAFKAGDDSRLRRIVWAVFRSKATGEFFTIINTHFSLSNSTETEADLSTPLSQANELIAFCENLQNLYPFPVIITGDFNAKKSTASVPSPVYDLLSESLYDAKTESQTVSYSKKKKTNNNAVDHIFFNGEINIRQYFILSCSEFEILSDHYPVFTDISF